MLAYEIISLRYICISNFTPLVRSGYRVGVPTAGCYTELLNTDSEKYGGSGVGVFGEIHTQDVGAHGRENSLQIDLPPLATVMLQIKQAADGKNGA